MLNCFLGAPPRPGKNEASLESLAECKKGREKGREKKAFTKY